MFQCSGRKAKYGKPPIIMSIHIRKAPAPQPNVQIWGNICTTTHLNSSQCSSFPTVFWTLVILDNNQNIMIKIKNSFHNIKTVEITIFY